MTFDPMFITTNFFVQAQRSAELMAEQDEKIMRAIEKIQADGYSLKSIGIDYFWIG
jgi:hypothetical protein